MSESSRGQAPLPGILVVLFHPDVEQVRHLLNLQRFSAYTAVVDNSTTLDPAVHQTLREAGIPTLCNGNKGGIAGAFNRGLDHLVEKRCDPLFLLDQDSVIDAAYWNSMLGASARMAGQRYMVGPKVFDVNVERYLPAHVLHRWSIEHIPIGDAKYGLIPCSCIISSGTMLTADTYQYLGHFREDYFIDHVDTEYCFRALSKGVPIFVHTDATLPHQISRRCKRKFLGRNITQWNMTPRRQYYSARNCLLIARMFAWRRPLVVLINFITFFQLVSVLLYEEQKLRKLAAMAAGILDGLSGKSGDFEELRARLARVCDTTSPRTGPPAIGKHADELVTRDVLQGS